MDNKTMAALGWMRIPDGDPYRGVNGCSFVFFASRSTVPDLSALIQGNTSKRFQLSWRYVVPHRWRGWRLFSAAHPTVLDDISSS